MKPLDAAQSLKEMVDQVIFEHSPEYQLAQQISHLFGLVAIYCFLQLLIVGVGLVIWTLTDKDKNMNRMWAEARQWLKIVTHRV